MDDQALVGVLHRPAEQQEELQALRRVELPQLGILAERHPFHVFHDEVGEAVGGGAAIEQARDVRMVEPGEDLPLGAEAPHDRLGVHPAFQDLERDTFVERVVVAHREINRAHAALAELAHEAVGADACVRAVGRAGLAEAGDVVWADRHGGRAGL